MKKNLTLLSLLLCCILCCSCGKEKEPQNKPTKTENYSQVYANRMQITEEGIYYIDGYTKLMKFYDFALKDSIPLCDKPNCKHKNAKCNAYLENGFQSAMGCYRGKLYYFDMNKPTLPLYQCDDKPNCKHKNAKCNAYLENGFQSAMGCYRGKLYYFDMNKPTLPLYQCDKNGKNQHKNAKCNAYLENGFQSAMGCYRGKLYYFDMNKPTLPLYQCDKNGKNQKVLAQLNDTENTQSCSISLPMFFIENKLILRVDYSTLLDEPIIREDGTADTLEYKWSIIEIALDTGDVTLLKEPEIYSNINSAISLIGANEHSVIYTKIGTDGGCYIYDTVSKKEEKLFELSKEKQLTFLNYDRKQHMAYHLNTDSENCIVFQTNVDTKETKEIFRTKHQNSFMYFEVYDNIIYYTEHSVIYTKIGTDGGCYIYDTVSKKEEKLFELSKEKQLTFLNYDRKQRMAYHLNTDAENCIVFQTNVDTKETKEIFRTKHQNSFMYFEVYHNIIYYTRENTGEMKSYDLETKTEKNLSKEEYTYLGRYENPSDWYVTLAGEEGFVCISKKDYEKKNWKNVQIIGKF